ncbi:MAG: chromosomal replication initiator protein DnaA [Nitrospinae bacterium]|nr:chromosomal replication initiator protein DnaA [Nitrospinota bacterium]
MEKNRVWDICLQEIKKIVDTQIYEKWFHSISLFSINDDVITITVPNTFHRDWLNEHYSQLIKDTINKIYNKKLDIHFNIQPIKKEDKKTSISLKERDDLSFCGLNSKYTFKNFVVGSSNQFAHAASLAVAERPAEAYNPLFIYGGVGLGKTHLMHAIGHFIYNKKPGVKLCYLPSENFVVDLISSIQHGKMDIFRNKYRNMEVLLIDDIQFIAGKDRSQEEFFHTFNTLYQSHRQIIISSDKFPKDIPGLEERLRSRFECGLIADILIPELETRVAILKQKAEENNINLLPEVALFIGNKIKSNIRELEGSLLRISAYSSITGREIDTDLVDEILKDIFHDKERAITIDNIQKAVANFFNIKVSDLKSIKRDRKFAVPRQIGMYLSRNMTKSSLSIIGDSFGGKDHTTVLHSLKKINSLITENREISSAIKKITEDIK